MTITADTCTSMMPLQAKLVLLWLMFNRRQLAAAAAATSAAATGGA
jgi:hypothetical protein